MVDLLRFRAWDKETQTMLDVSLIDFKKSVLVGEHWDFGETNFINFNDIHLMQSTGLFDENDKEIFDGDILKVKIMSGQSWLETVRYNDEKAMFVSKEVKRKVLESPLYDLFITDLFEVEVIGNSLENPELLEVTE